MNARLPPALFLGFIAKKLHPVPPGEWGGAEEICSVSPCIARYPDGWDDRPFDPPAFNPAYCMTKAADARNRVADAERPLTRIYALKIIPAVFTKDSPTPNLYDVDELFARLGGLPELPDERNMAGFERLGYDATVFGPLADPGPCWGWSCSPLSCNFMAQSHPVNRYCLIDDLDGAVAVAKAFARDEPEPGPYVIVEVFREAAV